MLSIIIPTLNEEKYLPSLLEAIKKQTFKDYEIIIADAGSGDKTLEIAKNFGCKIVPGGLPARGRNKGAKAAQGDIFLFMDADNIHLSENFLEQLTTDFKKRNLDVASFPIYPKGNGIDKLIYGIYNWWVKSAQKFSVWATNSVLVRKEIFEKINGFNEEIKIAEDHDFAKRAARISKFGFIKTEPVLTSTRRFERDGRLRTYLKYILAALHIVILGPIKTDIFKYRFNHLIDKKKKL